MSSRIEQIIEEIEEYIDSCKFQPLSTTKIIVNKDQLDELLRELRMKTLRSNGTRGGEPHSNKRSSETRTNSVRAAES